jgi:hypothetical protein
MRARPKKYTHTPASKKAAAIIGQASSIGAALRTHLLTGLALESYKGFQNRLTAAIASWLRSHPSGKKIEPTDNIPSLLGVQYNEKGRKIDALWQVNRIIRLAGSGSLEIIILSFNPVKDLSVAPGTENVSFVLSAASITLDARIIGSASFEFSFDYIDTQIEECIIRLELPTPAGSLLVSAAALRCRALHHSKWEQINPKIYGPASIVSAMYL